MKSFTPTMLAFVLAASTCAAVTRPATASSDVVAASSSSGPWSPALPIDEVDGNHPDINSPKRDGCPVLSPDGKSLYQASTRDGGLGGLDIWVSTRTSTNKPFGAPQHLPPPVNSPADDLCPTPLTGDRLLFVSRRTTPGVTCGLADIYLTRSEPSNPMGWVEPKHLPCAPEGPNTALDELGPSYVELETGAQLYFSSQHFDSASGLFHSGDLFVSESRKGMAFGPGVAIAELNAGGNNEMQPNVRKDGREMVFSSNRSGSVAGTQDIYISNRASVDDPWSVPVNLGPAINTAGDETRPTLSRDASTLLFSRRPGGPDTADIYISRRSAVAVQVKGEHLSGPRPDGSILTVRLHAKVAGVDASSLEGYGRHDGSGGGHIEWMWRGAIDGRRLELTGVITDSNRPDLIGVTGQLTADADSGQMQLTFGPLPSGPFAGETISVEGSGWVSVKHIKQ